MNADIFQRLLQLVPVDTTLELPPKVFLDMEGEFIEFNEKEKLVARFPNKERYMNPFGFMQGGILVAAMDNTISPLSYIAAPPNITKDIHATFKRPIKRSDTFIDVVATVVEKTATAIILKADVLNERGKLAASGVASCVFVKGMRRS